MLHKLEEENFVKAWLIAPVLSILPWLVFFLPFFLVWKEMSESTLLILYTGVIFLGMPISLALEYFEVRSRLIFLILGALAGQMTIFLVMILKIIGLYSLMGTHEIDPFSSTVALYFGSIHGALCMYFYHRIAYKS
jgi:hypothetical protein